MKIFLAQQNYHIGNFEENERKIIEGINRAKQAGADLVMFTELCVCGYPPRDFLEFNDFIHKGYETIDHIKEHADDIGVLIGSPAINPQKEGKDLFNAAFLLYEKQIKAEIHKTLLPNYDVFDEYRYFEPAFQWKCIDFKGKKLAVTICEDIWNLGDNPLYRITPMEMLIKEKPDVMLNISASPYNYAADVVRRSIIEAHTLKYGIPMLYCNTVGSQTEIVFDGGSLVYDANGNLVKEMKYFEEDYYLTPTLSSLAGEGENPSAQSSLVEETFNDSILSESTEANNPSTTTISEAGAADSSSVGGSRKGARKYYYSPSEVGRDSDTLKYLTEE